MELTIVMEVKAVAKYVGISPRKLGLGSGGSAREKGRGSLSTSQFLCLSSSSGFG